jgi:hypothetical protein
VHVEGGSVSSSQAVSTMATIIGTTAAIIVNRS